MASITRSFVLSPVTMMKAIFFSCSFERTNLRTSSPSVGLIYQSQSTRLAGSLRRHALASSPLAASANLRKPASFRTSLIWKRVEFTSSAMRTGKSARLILRLPTSFKLTLLGFGEKERHPGFSEKKLPQSFEGSRSLRNSFLNFSYGLPKKRLRGGKPARILARPRGQQGHRVPGLQPGKPDVAEAESAGPDGEPSGVLLGQPRLGVAFLGLDQA